MCGRMDQAVDDDGGRGWAMVMCSPIFGCQNVGRSAGPGSEELKGRESDRRQSVLKKKRKKEKGKQKESVSKDKWEREAWKKVQGAKEGGGEAEEEDGWMGLVAEERCGREMGC